MFILGSKHHFARERLVTSYLATVTRYIWLFSILFGGGQTCKENDLNLFWVSLYKNVKQYALFQSKNYEDIKWGAHRDIERKSRCKILSDITL